MQRKEHGMWECKLSWGEVGGPESGRVGQVQIMQGLAGHSQITRFRSKHKGFWKGPSKALEGFDLILKFRSGCCVKDRQ